MAKVRVFGPYRHGTKWRVHFVYGRGDDRTTEYETFAARADAQRCYDGATSEAQGVTVEAAIKAYVDAKRAQGRAELSIVAYDGRLRLLLADYLRRPVRSIQSRGAELYAAAQCGRAADSHRNLLTVGRLWGRWCVKQRWLRYDPFAEVEGVGRRVHGADKARLSVDESRQLEAWCLVHPDDQGAVLALAYLYLGARNTELAHRLVGDLDDDTRLLVIGRTKTTAGRRALRIPEALGELLRRLCAGRSAGSPVFLGARGRRMTSNAARKHVLRVCAAAGVSPLSPQALRRTQASLATEAGETAIAVARHLGHTTGEAPAVTERSYIERETAAAAQGERALRVIRGGKP
jgi:integrase